MTNMENKYLYIDGNHINYQDSAFSGIATVEDINKFCNEMAYEFRNSNLKNYDKLTKKQREETAKRWEKAKSLPNGRYDYYFNLEDKNKVFEKSVKELANTLGIKYELKIK